MIRRLGSLRHIYAGLVDEVRRHLSNKYLANGKLSLL
jgi:hypothetical protein